MKIDASDIAASVYDCTRRPDGLITVAHTLVLTDERARLLRDNLTAVLDKPDEATKRD